MQPIPQGPAPAAPAPLWRLYVPPSDDPPPASGPAAPNAPSPDWTLYEFFTRWAWPERMSFKCQPATRREYEYLFRPGGLWPTATGDPPIKKVRAETLTTFVSAAKKWPSTKSDGPLSPARIKTLSIYVQKLLLLAAPRAQSERAATKHGLYGLDEDGDPIYAPRFTDLDILPIVVERRPNPAKVGELEMIIKYLDAAAADQVVRHPLVDGIPPRRWWWAWYIVQFETGQRKGTLLRARFSELNRDDDGRLFLEPAASSVKGGKKEKSFFVSPQAEAAIETIRTERTLIFPWDCHPRHFDTVRHKILEASGLPENRRLGTHAVRKAHCTEAGKINAVAAQQQAGHAAIEMTSGHYIGPDVVAETSSKMRRPWTAPKAKRPDPAQLDLPFPDED